MFPAPSAPANGTPSVKFVAGRHVGSAISGAPNGSALSATAPAGTAPITITPTTANTRRSLICDPSSSRPGNRVKAARLPIRAAPRNANPAEQLDEHDPLPSSQPDRPSLPDPRPADHLRRHVLTVIKPSTDT